MRKVLFWVFPNVKRKIGTMRVVAADNSTTMLAAEKNEHKLGKESVSLTVSAEGGGPLLGEVMCAPGRVSHLLDRSLLKERNKRISSWYVNVNLQREREKKKKTDTEATGRLARIMAIWRGADSEQQLVNHILD